jgi:Zn-dependent protease with chaperone function
MMGKLTVEEWRPLIASSILFEKKMKRRLRGKAFLLTALPVILALAVPIAAAIVFHTALLILLYPVLVLPLAYLGSRSYSSELKKARLEADTQASAVVGKNQLLDILRKIDMMGLDDIDRLKTGRGGRRLAGLPSITERIQNLQGLSSLDSYTAK